MGRFMRRISVVFCMIFVLYLSAVSTSAEKKASNNLQVSPSTAKIAEKVSEKVAEKKTEKTTAKNSLPETKITAVQDTEIDSSRKTKV